VFALAGCGSGSAADGDESADTARVQLVITKSDREGRLIMSGAYDYRRRQGVIRTTLEGTPDAEADTPTETRIFGTRFYSKDESAAKWVVDTEDVGIGHLDTEMVPFPGSELDPKDSLAAILSAGDEVEVGEEDVRGMKTTHYRVTLDPESFSKELGGRPLDDDSGLITFDVWGDGAGRMRRIRMLEETATLTYEFFDFGVEVDVEEPPSDQVVTAKELGQVPKRGVCEPPRQCLEAGRGK